MSETTNLGLPFIQASQAQKHVTHNETLLALDALVQTGIVDRDLTSPPASPLEGDAYIPAVGSTSGWTGKDLNIATWQDGAWNFHAPKKGWIAYLADENTTVLWDGTNWSDLAASIGSLQNLAQLGINTAADATNKLAVASDAILFNNIGNGVQQKLNKNAVTDTASVLFQTNWSGRAEMGTTGDDDFHFKVSPDGAVWNEAIRLDQNSGAVTFPNGALLERHLPASVNLAGGADWWGPADHLTTSYSSGSTLSLVKDRMYFAAFYVPRRLQLLGCFVSQSVASTDTGALLRTGIYELGLPNGNSWDVGNKIADFGTQTCDVAGNKIFDLATPQTIEPGWYLTAFGVTGAAAKVIYTRWFTPGLSRFYPYGSGTSARPRVVGPSVYLYENASSSEIANGLPTIWTKNPVSDVSSTNNWVYQCVMPKWRQI